MRTSAPIVVIGSINMDLVCRTPAMPRPGETILGSDVVTFPGGKGANQAVAAAKLARDAEVRLIARVGDDDFGQRLLNGLAQHKVNTQHVTITEGVATGMALILVDKKGENTIVVAPGANHRLSPKDIDAAEGSIASAAVVVMQLEIPQETVRHAVDVCRKHGVFTILDPAPAPTKPMPRALYAVDVFTPNQSEAELILGLERTHGVRKKRVVDPKAMGSDLLTRGPRAVVVKLGAKGAVVQTHDGEIDLVKAFKVKVVDTTAAGDAFTAALAVGRAEGLSLAKAAKFAAAAGALTCTAFGAQPALPTREATDKLMASRA